MIKCVWRLVAVFLLVAATAPIRPQASATPDLFPYSQNWLGGDAAYSLPIDSTRTLWLFGDTFVGKTRNPPGMIHNSVAIRVCKPQCRVTYSWSRDASGRPDSFFKTAESDYFWPLDGVISRGKLYVFLERMRSTPKGGAFGFDYQSVRLAMVSNPEADPGRWRITYRSVSEGNLVVPGIATSLDQDNGVNYLFAFTLFRHPADHPYVGLLRHPLDDLISDTTNRHWQYLSTGSQWQQWGPSTSPANAAPLIDGNVTEMSVKYHAKEKLWLAVYPARGGLFTNASYSRASQLTGPWTTPKPLFRYPEMEKDDPRHTPHVFCYAAKEHPELESDHKLALTYACNSSEEAEIFRDLRLYKPNLVFVALP